MSEQWFPIYYSLFHSPVFDNPAMLKTWLMILRKKCYKPETKLIRGIHLELKPGDCVIESRELAAQFLKITENQYRNCIKKLEQLKFIEVKTTNKITVIKVIKEGYSNDYIPENNQQITNESPNFNQQTTNNIKYINNKNNKLINFNNNNQKKSEIIDDKEFDKQTLREKIERLRNIANED